jgi:hypothetical protein
MPDTVTLEVKPRPGAGEVQIHDVWEHVQKDTGEGSSRIVMPAASVGMCADQVAAAESEIEAHEAAIAELMARAERWAGAEADLATAMGT